MLLRGMNPEWLAVDEITSPADLAGIRQAFGCGVRILATIHAGSAAELREKPLCRAVLGAGKDRVGGKIRGFHRFCHPLWALRRAAPGA